MAIALDRRGFRSTPTYIFAKPENHEYRFLSISRPWCDVGFPNFWCNLLLYRYAMVTFVACMSASVFLILVWKYRKHGNSLVCSTNEITSSSRIISWRDVDQTPSGNTMNEFVKAQHSCCVLCNIYPIGFVWIAMKQNGEKKHKNILGKKIE